MEQLPVIFRDFTQDDVGLIFNSWLNSYCDSETGSDFCKGIEPKLYYKYHHLVIERLLPRSNVIIAAWNADPTIIFGYIVFEPSNEAIHYVYVKEAWRTKGLAQHLVSLTQLEKGFITHLTTGAKRMFNPDKFSYLPYLI